MALYHPVKIGALEIPGNLFLAPVAGYTDRVFRSVCAEWGADFSFTELVSAEALVRTANNGLSKTERLLVRGDGETRYAVQLFGSDPAVVARAASLLEGFSPDALDLNSGCPVPKVIKTGSGAALIREPARLAALVSAAVKIAETRLGGIPVTVKIRSGWDSGSINYRETARAAVEAGASLVSLHARTRAQGYSGKSDWSHIADLASRLAVPLIGSGDLYTPEDALRMLNETGCAGVMFARGALGNPFIFSATKSLLTNGSYTWPDNQLRLKTALRQLELLAADTGESFACREMRKQFCAYTKGISGGRGMRDRLVHAQTIAEYREILFG
ncbi:MAG: tRNA dihydrouridine synthase DusB [Spirochaetaceae bacterium]|jgi:nifR3 family TIM-barrel protein|nr:tRNA dihydrouridine synthase DusB [Spirochaetaceae bacterium]